MRAAAAAAGGSGLRQGKSGRNWFLLLKLSLVLAALSLELIFRPFSVV